MDDVVHFHPEEVQAARSALLEVALAMREFLPDVYLVGGWASYLLLQEYGDSSAEHAHQGTVDIDLLIGDVPSDTYATIVERLLDLGFKQRENRLGDPLNHSFVKKYRDKLIQVDLLAPQYGGTGKNRRHQQPQPGVLAQKARGGDLVPQHHWLCTLSGAHPSGGQASVEIRVADVAASIVMKGLAIGDRHKSKDFYDVYLLLKNYQEGPASVAQSFAGFSRISLVKEALGNLAEAFRDRDAYGPHVVARALGAEENEATARAVNDGYFTFVEFFESLFGNGWQTELLEASSETS